MAGESPDKSEQKRSSGETTRSERDPRVTVSASPSPSGKGEDGAVAVNGSGSGSGSASRDASVSGSAAGAVDQATAVFRAPRQEDGDSRLRAAVAAWVDAADEGSSTGDSEGAEAAEPAAASTAGAAPVESEDAAESKAPASGAPESKDAAESDAAESPAAEQEDAAKGDAPEAEAPEPAARKSEAVGPEAGPEAEGPGDEPATSQAAPVADASKADAAEAPKADAPKSDASKTEASKADAAEADAPKPDASKTEVPKPDAAKADADEASGTKPATPKPSDGEATGTKPATPKPSSTPTTGTDTGAGTTTGTPARPPAPDSRAASWGAKPSSAGASGIDQPSSARPSGIDQARPAGGSGIDQPTTAFKAVAPPAVDQPTAMLKLPASKREAAAERAGQYIPLRSDEAGAATDAPVRQPGAPKITPPPAAGPREVIPEHTERTRQQPLPPKPPLDLLAELTNTPPPAQTPVRSTVRRFKIWTPLVLLLLIAFAVVQILRPLPAPKLALTSSPSYTFAGGTLGLPWPAEGQSAVAVDGVGSLGTHGEQKPAPLASVAKTMTAYVILKEHPITGKQEGTKITVDQQAEDDAKKPDESTAPIHKDQQFTEKQMLELLMIPSGNNAARLLARWDAGNEEAFIAKMNAAAKELGMTSSTYTDPSGLKETTVSTPTDQLKLAQAVMQNDVFREIVNTPQIKIPGIPTTIYNNNKIVLKPGVSGIKTGSSTPAGGNLLWAADTVVDGKNQRIYGIVMGHHSGTTLDSKLTAAINNSYTLIQAVQKAVTSATVVKKGQVVGYVDNGLGGRTPLVAAKDLKAVGWPGLKVDVTLGDGGKAVPHSAKAGAVVGELSIGAGPGRQTAPVELGSALTEPGAGDKLTRVG
ncbi:serine hydrolase [Streptomyces sp. NPDC050485]|uniref:serine hydrolase n=1 Tax=Streptomyces sp. NPDC050485 TaxID=3365617 RepID=UPI003788F7DB